MNLENNWRQKSIQNLEKQDFGDPDQAPTNMVKRCLELCRIPVGNFTVEDLRLMIGQGFALDYLIPLAIEHLRKKLLVEGDFYPGDLLKNVLQVDPDFWRKNIDHWREVNNLVTNHGLDNLDKNLRQSYDTFKVSI